MLFSNWLHSFAVSSGRSRRCRREVSIESAAPMRSRIISRRAGLVETTPGSSEILERRTMLTDLALFDNNFFVDSSDGPPSEADNMRLSLEDLGHTVTPFTGIMAADFQTALSGADVLVIPELENSALHSSLDVAARTEIFDFVNNGGGLIINGSFFGRDEALLNQVFGFSLGEGGVPFLGFSQATGAVSGTAFDGGPVAVDNNFDTFLWDTASLPAGASSLYQDNLTGETAVAAIPVGSGEIVFLGWDWVFSDPPVAGGADGGWQELLDRAVSQVGGQTPAGVISLSGNDLMIEVDL